MQIYKHGEQGVSIGGCCYYGLLFRTTIKVFQKNLVGEWLRVEGWLFGVDSTYTHEYR